MKVVILGGTQFVGRHVVDAARARDHEVTLFNRGQTNPDLFPEVEKLHGDRDGDLTALRGRYWDVVVDTSGYVPRIVRSSAELLADAVEQYVFVSSISAYADFSRPDTDESAPTGRLEDEAVEDVTGETYGPLKALCEWAVEEAMPGRTLIVRPGLIVGPYDPTDRFTYWPHRVARGGDVLSPGRADRVIQIMDARDLAEWIVRMVEARTTGTYNATGSDDGLTMGRLLEECRAVSGSDARFVWVDEQFLLDQGVTPWIELPVWMPGEEYRGVLAVDVSRAVAAGLTFRPLADTVRDTLEWAANRSPEHEWKAGMTPERERDILQIWQTS